QYSERPRLPPQGQGAAGQVRRGRSLRHGEDHPARRQGCRTGRADEEVARGKALRSAQGFGLSGRVPWLHIDVGVAHLNPPMDNLVRRTVVGLAKFQLFVALVIFLPAGSLRYWQGWLFLLFFGLVCFFLW